MFTKPAIPSRLASRVPRRSSGSSPLRLDGALPAFDATVRRHAVVDASPGETYDAMLSADLTELGPVVGLLGSLRALPIRLGAWRSGASIPDPGSLTFEDIPSRGTWVRLADVDGEEFVFGAVGQVWKPTIDWVALDADEFRSFDRPGYAKIAAGLSVRPYGTDRTLITYEARTAGTDAAATRRFRRYWTFVSPFVGYILGRVLARIAADAEASARRRRA